jgi:hypothetical protein
MELKGGIEYTEKILGEHSKIGLAPVPGHPKGNTKGGFRNAETRARDYEQHSYGERIELEGYF